MILFKYFKTCWAYRDWTCNRIQLGMSSQGMVQSAPIILTPQSHQITIFQDLDDIYINVKQQKIQELQDSRFIQLDQNFLYQIRRSFASLGEVNSQGLSPSLSARNRLWWYFKAVFPVIYITSLVINMSIKHSQRWRSKIIFNIHIVVHVSNSKTILERRHRTL